MCPPYGTSRYALVLISHRGVGYSTQCLEALLTTKLENLETKALFITKTVRDSDLTNLTVFLIFPCAMKPSP